MKLDFKGRVINVYPSKNPAYPETAVTMTDVTGGAGQVIVKIPPANMVGISLDSLVEVSANFVPRVSGFATSLLFSDGKITPVKG